MEKATISRTKLIELLKDALEGLPPDSGDMYDLSDWKYYYHVDPQDSFMRTLSLAPRAELVGDVWDDVAYLSNDATDLHMPPQIVLERLSYILLLLGYRDDLKNK